MTQKHISYEDTIWALKTLGSALEDDHLGLHIGELLSLRVTAGVDDIMQHSQTLEASFDSAVEYSKIISDALECWIEKDQNFVTVVFEENPNWKVYSAFGRRQILDLTLLSALKSLTTYTSHLYHPTKVDFEYAKPRGLREHYRLFNCRLNFNRKQSRIVFERHIFKKHAKTIQHDLLASLKEKIAAQIKLLAKEDPLVYRLKKLILKEMPGRVSVGQAANEMNQSPRTLQRNLKALDTTYKGIENQLQLRLAKTYLEEGEKSLDEIAYLLGFSEKSAFVRFFKAQCHVTPRAYGHA